MRFGSVCSGIEAASVAWKHLGWEAVWFAEVDKAASQVLAYRFPTVPNLGDMTKLAAMVLAGEIEAPDILVGGTPCQDFSIAGLRAGLAGDRGQLTLAFIILANAIDEVRARNGLPPCIIVWENVPGVLNHASNPLGCLLAGLSGDDEALEPGPRPESGRSVAYWTWDKKAGVHRPKWPNAGAAFGPQRAVAWRVLDAQYFGLAQRRRRVFAVASAREGFDPGAILLEFEGLRRDSAPSREAGEGVTHAPAPCLTSSGRGVERTGDPRGQDAVVACWHDGARFQGETDPAGLRGGRILGDPRVAATLDASYGKLQGCSGQDANHGHSHLVSMAFGGSNQAGPIDVATACNAHGIPHGRLDFETETFVVEPLPFDTTQITSATNRCQPRHGDPCHPLAAGAHPPTIAFYPTNRQPEFGNYEDISPPLKVGSGHASGNPVGVAYPIAFSSKAHGGDAASDLAPTLRAGGCKESHANAGVPPAIAYSVALRGREGGATAELGDDLAGCLRASTGGGDKPHVLAPIDDVACVTGDIAHTLKAEGFDASEDGTGRGQPMVNVASMAVRRLMPVECERLQGFSDGHTRVPVRHYKVRRVSKNRPAELWEPAPQGGWWLMAADGPRYKQCGNSMATHVMRWIGERIQAHLNARIVDPFAALLGHNGGPPLDPLKAVLG